MIKSESTVGVHQMQRNWGEIADRALSEPVIITAKGRPRHVLVGFEEYQRLKARDRIACRIEDLPDDIAGLMQTGLDALWSPDLMADDDDTLIS